MLAVATSVATGMIVVALILNFARLLVGPNAVDRILALDTFSIDAIALLVLIGVRAESTVYFEAAVLIALVGFVGTVTACRFVLRGSVVD
jgi:multicomponent K+:H+ antiporter subunit F